ncbi:MAG: DUF935 family protein [Opitutales bacterium]
MNKVEDTQKLSIRERIALIVRGEIPVSRKTSGWRRPGDREESGLEYMDVDQLWNAIKHAEDGYTDDLFAIYRDVIANDAHIQAEFGKRKLAVLGDSINIAEADEDNPADKTSAEAIQKMFRGIRNRERKLAHMLDSTLWPVSVMEKVYRRSREPGLNYELADLIPVEADLLDFSEGKLRIHDSDPETGRKLQTTHACDPARYMVHRGHILSLPDEWGGPMRAILFWCLLSTMDRTWWANFLDKYGSPFMVGKYDQNDDASRSILSQAFSLSKKLGGLVVSKETDVELKEAARSDAGDAFEKFHNICQREKSKLILGQTLSAEAQPTGLGSGVANSQGEVREDIRKFDSILLGSTIKDQLFRQYLEINNIPGECPSATWGSDSPEELGAIGELLKKLKDSGLSITDEGLETLNKRLGFSVQKDQAAVAPGGMGRINSLRALTADPDELIVERGTADIAQAFRSDLAPVRQLIRRSQSPEDLESSLRTLFADWKPGKVETLVADALTAFAANGSASQPDT